MTTQTRVGSVKAVVVDVNDMDRAAEFWKAMLGAKPLSRPEPYLRLELPDGPPHLLLQLVPEPNRVKARLHLDVAVPDLDEGVRQVEALGGRKLQDAEEHGNRFIVMADTEGNEFCLVPEDD